MSLPALGHFRGQSHDPQLSRLLVRQLAEAAGTRYALFETVDQARIMRGRPFQFLREEMPRDVRAKMAAEGTLSLVCVPVLVDGSFVAYLGYDDRETPRRWSPAEEEASRAAASVIGSAMQRAEGLETLRRRERMLGAVGSCLGASADRAHDGGGDRGGARGDRYRSRREPNVPE